MDSPHVRDNAPPQLASVARPDPARNLISSARRNTTVQKKLSLDADKMTTCVRCCSGGVGLPTRMRKFSKLRARERQRARAAMTWCARLPPRARPTLARLREACGRLAARTPRTACGRHPPPARAKDVGKTRGNCALLLWRKKTCRQSRRLGRRCYCRHIMARQPGHDIVEVPRAGKAVQPINACRRYPRVFPPSYRPPPSSSTQCVEVSAREQAQASHVNRRSPTEGAPDHKASQPGYCADRTHRHGGKIGATTSRGLGRSNPPSVAVPIKRIIAGQVPNGSRCLQHSANRLAIRVLDLWLLHRQRSRRFVRHLPRVRRIAHDLLKAAFVIHPATLGVATGSLAL